MAFTQLDPHTALLLIDLQHGVVALPVVHDAGEIVQRGAALAAAFRVQGLPVVLVNVAGAAPGRTEQARPTGERPANWAELVPELAVQPQDLRITKRTWGAFFHTDLHQQLQALGITQLVLAGIATSIGVESTARQAFELGYHVSVVTDAVTDMHADAHHNSITRIFPRLGETGSTADLLALLAARQPAGR
ncbi:Nicotinamidase-related amidase [Andreprevotia lacus DSM 23236]|jgi:nicotinamidase-related amidase|uniref:Nicotinamidase-related amidase n=1 Tax=Andreprevotia lacus DSM 23236 TaxID=1121001 RepID=A0A1W1X8S8_9NEIS|nr:isochorismatase family protein [Andreprevotia lacus]SMC20346.1 Nicotinamidase-related amidase [Andreprevotia lacus DSM 23236]